MLVVPPARRPIDGTHAVVKRYHLDEIESRILTLLANGYRVPTIARTLHYAPGTVRNRLSVMYVKVGVKSQVGLIELLLAERQDD